MTISELENVVTHLNDEISTRDNRIVELENQLEELQTDFNSYRESVSTLMDEVTKTAERNSIRDRVRKEPTLPPNGVAGRSAGGGTEGRIQTEG